MEVAKVILQPIGAQSQERSPNKQHSKAGIGTHAHFCREDQLRGLEVHASAKKSCTESSVLTLRAIAWIAEADGVAPDEAGIEEGSIVRSGAVVAGWVDRRWGGEGVLAEEQQQPKTCFGLRSSGSRKGFQSARSYSVPD